MSRTTNSTEQLSPTSRLADHQADATRFAAEQAVGKTWTTLPGHKSVGFMELRGCMCRWPIDDPQHAGATRYCGSTCSPETSYCAAHRQMAFAPSKGRPGIVVRRAAEAA